MGAQPLWIETHAIAKSTLVRTRLGPSPRYPGSAMEPSPSLPPGVAFMNGPHGTCPTCSVPGRALYSVARVPSTSNVLFHTQAEARAVPMGALELATCDTCGLLWNAAFDESLVDYREGYEETQSFSPTFRSWLDATAGEIAQEHQLEGKLVVEIGCGKGEFLASLCAASGARGLGIDPSASAGRVDLSSGAGLEFLLEPVGNIKPINDVELIVCRHTLEHILRIGPFLREIERACSPHTPLLIEVPDLTRVLAEGAFWDLYHEHATYFTPGSLARWIRSMGRPVQTLGRVYSDQNLMLFSDPGRPDDLQLQGESPIEQRRALDQFNQQAKESMARTSSLLNKIHAGGGTSVLWGAGSKATGLLVTLAVEDQVAAVVDINPDKTGSHIAGTGHRVIGPGELQEIKPDLVLVMNSLYCDEISASLKAMGLAPRIEALS
ncbi:MAG: methyltransferase [Planctomycetes bacterium]|nr:methyltransferase [Planctomycetota bacterium]